MKNLNLKLRFNKIFIIVFLLLICYVVIFTKLIRYKSIYDYKENSICGMVKSYKITTDKISFGVKAKEKIIVNMYYKTKEELERIINDLHLGDTYLFEGKMNDPSNNTIPNTFNYKKYLYNHKIYYIFTAKKLVKKESNNLIYKIKDKIYNRALKMKNNEYILAFIMGDKSLLTEEYQKFSANGVSHLFAVSGMHISLLLAGINFLLKNIGDNKRLIISILFLGFFSFLTNFSASVLRATLFYILNQLNKKLNLRFNNLEILFITAFILVVVNPFFIYDLGFLYSFAVCFGIMYYSEKITGNYLAKLFKISIISFLFSLPISAYTNYEVNIMSLFNNIIFVPLISFVIYPMSIFTFFLPVFSGLYSLLITFLNILNTFFSHLSIVVNIPKLPILIIILFYLFLILAKSKKKYIYLLGVLIIIAKIIPTLNPYYQVLYFDVNQGDSAVLISPFNKEVIMIDTGGKVGSNQNYKVSDNVIKYLKSIGISRVNNLIFSHGDFDHIGDAQNIINNLKVEKVTFNCGKHNNLEKKLIKELESKNIDYSICKNELKFNNNTLYFLNTRDFGNENDNSSVIYTELDNKRFLFMGDASIKIEKAILNKYKLSAIDVLKVGHHGSKTSSSIEFINTINPIYSIISVGKNNRYGHPNKEALSVLKNSMVYRTDQDGSIMFKIKNNKLEIETCTP